MLEPNNKKEQAENQNELEVSENSFWTPMKIKALIGLIIFMSVALAVGFGFFIYKLVNTVLSKTETREITAKEQLIEKTQSTHKAIQSGIKLDGFKIQHLAATEMEIILHVKKEALSEIWVIEKKTKRITSKIILQK
ncbi:MAG: hypothetical protein JJ964_00820 [Rhizobiales bacterium]|nr:hypothetical protein [Hyphomicrobiales bacterium]